VAFHDNFWVVTGTAAPTIALACVVQINRTYGILTHTAGEMARQKKNSKFRFLLAVIAVIINTLNLGIQAVVLMQSLNSLATQKNNTSVHQTVNIEFYSIIALVYTVVIVSWINYKSDNSKEVGNNTSGSANPAEEEDGV